LVLNGIFIGLKGSKTEYKEISVQALLLLHKFYSRESSASSATLYDFILYDDVIIELFFTYFADLFY
jgi:hypothetical protein